MDKPGSNGHSRFHQGKQILEHNALLVPCLFSGHLSGHLFVFGVSHGGPDGSPGLNISRTAPTLPRIRFKTRL